MAREYLNGLFVPTRPDKYVGDVRNIRFRSSWERKCMIWFDTTPTILKWSSEEHVIPYVSPVDKKPHRYFVDFIVQYETRSGEIKRAAVEVKPEAQTKPPKQPKRMTKQFMESVKTYAVNEAKWLAARKWCDTNGFDFLILTERDLFPGGKVK